MTFARPSSEKGRSPGYDAPEVRHSRMLLAGIQVEFGLDSDESIPGVTVLPRFYSIRQRVTGKVKKGPVDPLLLCESARW
jgi:hypothetical protein